MNMLRFTTVLALASGLLLTSTVHAAAASPDGSIMNFSSLVQVPAGGSAPTLGFVVSGPKMLLVRAVGSSLTSFGIQNPAASPIIHIYDGSGYDITHFGQANGTQINWAGVFASLGAFPLTGTNDAYELVPVLSPGGFSIQVADGTGNGGTVLIEVYDASALGLTVIGTSGTVTVSGAAATAAAGN